MTALTAICRHCHREYGDHAVIGLWCPEVANGWFSRTQKFSEDLFTSSGSSFPHRDSGEGVSAHNRLSGAETRQCSTLPDSLHGLCRDVRCNRLECQRDLREHQQEVLARYQQELSGSGSEGALSHAMPKQVREAVETTAEGQAATSTARKLPDSVLESIQKAPLVTNLGTEHQPTK